MLRPIFQSFNTRCKIKIHGDFQEERYVDIYREKEYTMFYTVAELFPDESPKEAIKRELANLKLHEYIETVKIAGT